MSNATCTTSVKWKSGAKEKIEEADDKVLYTISRMTLDMTYTHIPLATYKNAGKLRQSSTSAGVRGSDGDYYIGSYTNYAKYVWNMGSNTNWSTPGTYGKWYEEVFKKQKNSITKNAVERNKLK